MKLTRWIVWAPIFLFLLGEFWSSCGERNMIPATTTPPRVVLAKQAIGQDPFQEQELFRAADSRPIAATRDEVVGDMLLGLGLGSGTPKSSLLPLLGLSLGLLIPLKRKKSKTY